MHHRRPNGASFSEADEYAVRRPQTGPPGRGALERNAPNLLADYLYLWETTVARQAIETARTSVSSGGHSSSYWCQQRQLAGTERAKVRDRRQWRGRAAWRGGGACGSLGVW